MSFKSESLFCGKMYIIPSKDGWSEHVETSSLLENSQKRFSQGSSPE